MDILSYLTELIKTNKSVGIEGLGTFLKQKKPGRYDVEKHSFTPPSSAVEFTSEVKENSLLGKRISEERNISLESANYFIQQFSEKIIEDLQNSGKADIGSLGNLVTDESGSVYLEKYRNSNEYYGFPIIANIDQSSNSDDNGDATLGVTQIEVDPITDEQETFDEITEHIHLEQGTKLQAEKHHLNIETPEGLESEETTEGVKNEVENKSEKQLHHLPDETTASDQNQIQNGAVEPESATTDNKDQEVNNLGTANIWHFDRARPANITTTIDGQDQTDDSPKKMALWIKAIIAFTVLGLIVLVAYLIQPNFFRNGNNSSISIKNKASIAQPLPVVADSAMVKDSTTTPLDTVRHDSTVVSKSSQIPADTTITWEIIGASLTKKEVQKYITDMKAKGFTAKAVTMPGKRRVKMSIATFYDEESAKQGRKDLVKKLKNDDLYIYQNKHTYKPL